MTKKEFKTIQKTCGTLEAVKSLMKTTDVLTTLEGFEDTIIDLVYASKYEEAERLLSALVTLKSDLKINGRDKDIIVRRYYDDIGVFEKLAVIDEYEQVKDLLETDFGGETIVEIRNLILDNDVPITDIFGIDKINSWILENRDYVDVLLDITASVK